MAQMSVSFGSNQHGLQVGYSDGSIEFHPPPERLETPPAPFATIPFSRDPDFVNRGDILDQIDQRCSDRAARVALVGLGGVGKSQLAIEFAHRIAGGQSDTWVFWVHAGTQARVEEGFRTIADTVKLPGRNQPKADIPQLVYGWLSNKRNGEWIMILDSADDRDVFYATNSSREGKPLADYLPQSPNGSILITTRNKDLAYRLTGNHKNIEVGPMVLADALTLLEKKLGRLSDRDVAEDLVQTLDLVPLAISQAAAYIQARSPMSSVEKYLAEFRKSERKRASLLSHDAGDLRRDGGASNAILTTWKISFDHIRSRRPSATDLLSLMSYFDRQGIAISLLKPVTEGVSQVTRFDASEDSGSESGGSDSEGDDGFQDDVATLRDFCLVATNEDGSAFEMHGLVQLSMWRWLEADGLQETFKQRCIERMAASFPIGEYENWETCRSLFAHVQVVLGYRPSGETVETWAALLHNGGWYAWSQGRYDIAEQMLGKAEKVCEKKLGKESWPTLSCMRMFAIVLTTQRRWEEAEKRFVQVMEAFKTEFGVDHPETLNIRGNLASMFLGQNRLEEAKELLEQLLEASKIKLGVDHPETLKTMANLASTYGRQGRWEEAEKLEMQSLEASKTKLGADHLDTLASIGNLASTFWNQGRWEEAEKLFLQVMETSKTKLGADHPYTLTSMNNLAFTWKHQGRYADALVLMEDCAQARQRVLGAKHSGL